MLSIPGHRSIVFLHLLLLGLMAPATPAGAQAPAAAKANELPILTVDETVAWALQNNPELAVYRQQRGIANAGIVIARTYPFNPVWASAILGVSPPAGVDVTNRVFNQHTLAQEVELRGQRKIRCNIAAAVLSRVEWEIATQEQRMAVRTIRAFHGYLYRQEKLSVLEETIRLQEQTTEKVKRLVDQGKLKAADQLLARSDEVESRAQRGSRQTLAVMAWHDLRRLMGVQGEFVEVSGRLPRTPVEGDADQWTELAHQQRSDLKAAHMTSLEAEQRERLEIANRFGNPTVGVKTEYNESRVAFVGPTLQFPVPVFNTKRGEIQQRQAEKTKSMIDKQRLEIQINHEVLAALDRQREARKWVQAFETEILPTLRKTMDAFDELFAQGEPGADVMRLIDVRRRYLRSRDSYLDALWELSQARADLADAVGDFMLSTSDWPAPARLGIPQE